MRRYNIQRNFILKNERERINASAHYILKQLVPTFFVEDVRYDKQKLILKNL